MKSLLAAALAGALTVSAIPVNASAVVNKFKYSGYEHSHAGDILNELGSYSDANAFDVIYEGGIMAFPAAGWRSISRRLKLIPPTAAMLS